MDFNILSTGEIKSFLEEQGIGATLILKVHEGSSNIVAANKNGEYKVRSLQDYHSAIED